MRIDVGSKVGAFDVVARVGSGGMAELFLGKKSGPGGFARSAAIKVIHPELANEAGVKMFLDEARLSARIAHPNVVHVEELGEQDGQYYLVMEYIDGVSLAELLTSTGERREYLAPDVVVAIASQLADGLHGAHETTDDDGGLLGLVHRDVSPQNVLVSVRGHVKLIDFGVAKAKNRLYQSIGAGLKGKLAYMAPEQVVAGTLDRRTDLFALGVVVWEMLTHRRLFKGLTDLQTLEAVREAEVQPPSASRKGVPEALDRAVLRALSREPEERPQTGLEMRRDLLAAVPDALMVDAGALGELVGKVARKPLATRRASLPPELDLDLESTVSATPSTLDERVGHASTAPPPAPSAEGVEALEKALERARGRDRPLALARALGDYGVALVRAGELSRAAAVLEEADALVAERAQGLAGQAANWRATLAEARGDLGAQLEATKDAAAKFEEAGLPRKALAAAVSLGELYVLFGMYDAAEAALAHALGRARQLGIRIAQGHCHVALADARIGHGQLEQAGRSVEEAARIGESVGDARLSVFAAIRRTHIELAEGDNAAALATATGAAARAERDEIEDAALLVAAAAAQAELENDRLEQARERTAAAVAAFEKGPKTGRGAELLLAVHARALAACGLNDAAKEAARRAREHVESTASRIADQELRARFLAVFSGDTHPPAK